MDDQRIRLWTPRRVVEDKRTGYGPPRIVDWLRRPVASFGNQIASHERGWSWAVARAIEAAVNGRPCPASEEDLRLPWRVVENKSYSGPRIVDADGAPVLSFANQLRSHPGGEAWAWAAAREIVEKVNALVAPSAPGGDDAH